MANTNFQWRYGVVMSGLSFTLQTASGTPAIYPNPANLSGVMSLDNGQAITALGAVISGVASSRFYTIATISAANMNCYTWTVLVTSNSGCNPTTIHGVNISGPAVATDCSGLDKVLTACSGNNNILVAVSGLKNDVSGLPGIWLATSGLALRNDVSALAGTLTAASGPVVLRAITHTNALVGLWGSTHTSAQIARVTDLTNAGSPSVDVSAIANRVWLWDDNSTSSRFITGGTGIDAPAASINVSGIAAQVWNSLTTTYTSSITFGGSVMVSGKLATVSGLDNILVASSGNDKIYNSVSGFDKILTAVSGVSVNASGNDKLLSAISGLKNDVSGIPALYLSNSGHALTSQVSGFDKILTAVSGLWANGSGTDKIYTAVSGFDKILTAVSGLWSNGSGTDKILTAVSGIPTASASSVAGIATTDATVLTSGTLAHDSRMVRHFTWNDMVIDKRYTPARQYHYNGTNQSSWFDIADDSNIATRVRGG